MQEVKPQNWLYFAKNEFLYILANYLFNDKHNTDKNLISDCENFARSLNSISGVDRLTMFENFS